MPLADRSAPLTFGARVLGELWRYGRGQKSLRLLSTFCAATVLQSLANGLVAACAGLLGQSLVGRQLAYSAAFVDTRARFFPPLLLCFLGFAAAVVKTGAGAVSMYGQKQAAFQVGNAVRKEISDSILRHGQERGAAAGMHAALAVRLREVERSVDEGVFAGLRAAVNLIPLAVTLVLLSSTLALLALACLVPFAVMMRWARRSFRARHARALQLAEDLHAGVDELVRHLDLWRTYGAGERVQRALEATGEEAARAGARADATRTTLSGANEVLAAGALLGAVALVERGTFPLGQGSLVAFAAVFFLMYRPLRELGDARTAIERGALALADLDLVRASLEGARPHEADSGLHSRASTSCTPRWSALRLDVHEISVVRGEWSTPPTTFRAEPGEIVALVGPTGSGKTTLLRALLGLERGTKGRVLYGDHDLSCAGVGPRERPFAWVPQESAIVSGTLAENIALGNPSREVTDSAIFRDLLARLGASSLLERHLSAHIQAGGPELSGGERQWIAIARALASDLPVLLLDEPTSGLDADSQARVLEILKALRGHKTVILVTHRPEPLAIADRVVALGNGLTLRAEAQEDARAAVGFG